MSILVIFTHVNFKVINNLPYDMIIGKPDIKKVNLSAALRSQFTNTTTKQPALTVATPDLVGRGVISIHYRQTWQMNLYIPPWRWHATLEVSLQLRETLIITDLGVRILPFRQRSVV